MPTRMAHPLHGFTHAYDNNEIAYLKARGWSVEVPVVEPAAPADTVTFSEPPQKKKPGPKPKAK